MELKDYTEYVTCTICGLKKYCRLVAGRFICYSCENGNFKGLKGIDNVQRRDSKQG